MGDKDFFLSPDDAQTLGDIDYMRKAKRTRRTFPKTLKNKDGFALENEVSSIEDRNKLFKGNGNGSVNTTFSTSTFQSQPASQVEFNNNQKAKEAQQSISFEAPKPAEERRQPDNSMDMFRNMAKNIRRR